MPVGLDGHEVLQGLLSFPRLHTGKQQRLQEGSSHESDLCVSVPCAPPGSGLPTRDKAPAPFPPLALALLPSSCH